MSRYTFTLDKLMRVPESQDLGHAPDLPCINNANGAVIDVAEVLAEGMDFDALNCLRAVSVNPFPILIAYAAFCKKLAGELLSAAIGTSHETYARARYNSVKNMLGVIELTYDVDVAIELAGDCRLETTMSACLLSEDEEIGRRITERFRKMIEGA